MRQEIWSRGVDSLVIPNGIGSDALRPPDVDCVASLRERMQDRIPERPDGDALVESLTELDDADVVNVRTQLTPAMNRILYGGSAAVLANSGREPFGLVGLESMAAGGVTCVGGTGEDYAVPGWNALLLQTDDPREFLTQFEPLATNPKQALALRRRAVTTARQFLWSAIVRRNLLPRIRFVGETHRGASGWEAPVQPAAPAC